VTPLLVAAGVLAAFGAAVATGARDPRIASLGLAGMLVTTPFVADPLPQPLSLAFGAAAGILAAFFLFSAARRLAEPLEPPLGALATIASAAAGFVVGLGASAVSVPRGGPDAALAAGLAAVAVAVGPIAVTRDVFRLGTALIVLLDGALLLMEALAGTPDPLVGIAAGVALVVLAATAGALVRGAVSATGATAIQDDPLAARAAASRSGTAPR
jgi:hypothetical protein